MSSSSPSELLSVLEDTGSLLRKAEANVIQYLTGKVSLGYMETRLNIIEDYWNTYRQNYLQLTRITSKVERTTMPYFVEQEYHIFEEMYISMKADLRDRISAYTTTSNQSSNSNNNSNVTESGLVKLPRIQLPTFRGNYEEWPMFQDLFVSLVHDNSTLSNVQKLHYLKSSVSGEAEALIRHMQVTHRNYLPAWEILKTRYGNKRLIVNSVLRRLFNQKKMIVQSATPLRNVLDTTTECINNLKNLDINTDSWDPIIIFLIVQKLDPETHKDWEESAYKEESEDLPTWKDLKKFLELKFRTLEMIQKNFREKPIIRERTYHTATASTSAVDDHAVADVDNYTFAAEEHSISAAAASVFPACKLCKEEHLLCHCKEFGKWVPEKRSDYVRENRLCYNCLSMGHSVYYCKQKTSCRICGKRHHSLLHSYKKKENPAIEEESQEQNSSLHARVNENKKDEQDVSIASHFTSKPQRALLATALVPVKGSSGQITMLRALIDPGSQASFVSERATQILQLKKSRVNGTITGVGSTKTSVSHVVQLEILSQYERDYFLPINAYVLSTQLTTQLPCKEINPSKWSHLEGLNLADPSYFTPGKIDMLLGIDVYTDIIKNNLVKGPSGTPSAQETSLGWILFGSIKDAHADENTIVMHHQVDIDIDNMLRSMWEIDNSTKRNLTADEKQCERIYETTHTRTPEGRYVVKLPFKANDVKQLIGETKDTALMRFYQLERKLERNPKLKEEYTKVMEEYIQLNHMEEVPREDLNKPAIYLPHHAVQREDKETTKVRVVFDASCKGKNNQSLNDQLLVGPQLQEDLRNIIMRWRTKPICYVADIQKMYRQILVTKEDADCQRLFWRKNTSEDLKEYRLLRVTFGTASAPYLAVKTLIQLAIDEGSKNMQLGAAQVIREDFFVDDCMSGCFTVEDAKKLSKQLIQILQKGGFELQKWASNSTELMKEIEPSMRSAKTKEDNENEKIIKTLGLTWSMTSDFFHYKFNLPEPPEKITKRNILADIQRLFDPLGWLGAAIISTKILIQKMWIEKFDWDERVSEEIEEEWLKLRNSFEDLKEIKINRWLKTNYKNIENITLHGFCDASNKAYCAVVYCRSETEEGEINTEIVASKTRVAPVKPVSLPRLELLGAVLLAKLLTQAREAMRIPVSNVYAWTDSSVVLSWLFGDPSRWKTFVSNRVVEILDNTHNSQWFHVSSKENPADVGSRGTTLLDLKNNNLWWKGPEWLRQRDIQFSRPHITPTDIEKKEKLEVNLKIQNKIQGEGINFENLDDLPELLRVIVHCKKFINSKKQPKNIDLPATTEDLQNALNTCVKIVQKQEYQDDIERLKNKKNVKKTSTLKTLNPYLDEEGILRVGGRLRNSNLEIDKMHPIILGTKNALTHFIIADAHKRTLHGGVQLTLCYIRSKFWIIRVKNAIKSAIHKCFLCTRHKASMRTQLMGDLPRVRTTPSRPFLHSGVDFAGPLLVLMSKGRGAKSNKAYIAIFVCMATKAVHLELVGDMTTDSFIGAFNRFVARRGRCAHLWSDQGRTFIGANKELAIEFKQAKLELPGDVAEKLVADGTQWHFIPPYSPNFGGLWEAGVKSIKYHLKRILSSNLTFEEMTTTLCQIECCLNSRPLIPIDDSDKDALEPLTPGHFLIGEAHINVPSPDLRNININRLSRWQLTQRLVRDFWHRWRDEYLSRLQERPKWLKRTPEFDIGDIVLIKDDQLPPGKWSLGRIVDKHPGPDNVTRVYSVRSHNHIVKRSISKLCALPVDQS